MSKAAIELAVAFDVIGTPQQRGSKKPCRRGTNGPIILVDANKKSIAWMDSVRSAAHEAWGLDLLTCPVMLSVEFYFRRPKSHYRSGKFAHVLRADAPEHHAKSPDLAKLMRCIEDAITGVIWLDDKLVVGYAEPTQRYWTTSAEKAVVRIYTLSAEAQQ